MLAAGWHAHTLNAPGKFLVSAAEHDTPKRARAYLIIDQAVANTAATYADYRPPLDPISQQRSIKLTIQQATFPRKRAPPSSAFPPLPWTPTKRMRTPTTPQRSSSRPHW